MIRAFAAFFLFAALAVLTFAIPTAESPGRVIHDTGFRDVVSGAPLVNIGNVKIPNGGIVVASFEFRYAYEAENLNGPAVSGYQMGTRFEYHVGAEGLTLQSNACGGELAASDGVNWTGHLAIPTAPLGDGLDWHVVPRAGAVPWNLGWFPPGIHQIKVASLQWPQDWGTTQNPPPSPDHEMESRYMQVRVLLTVLN